MMRKLGATRAAAVLAAVFLGAMASLYVPAARAAQIQRLPLAPDRFVPAHIGIGVPGELWFGHGRLGFAD
jgi:hypothetical protein